MFWNKMEVHFYLCVVVTISNYIQSIHAVASLQEQLDHVANRVLESRLGRRSAPLPSPSRRADFSFDIHNAGGIVGAPSQPSHLPEAEPILPGHTLIRPAMGMLKSSIKFPHRELENGFGVNGNINSLGIRWDGRNERVLYTGFRRMPEDYIMVVPKKSPSKYGKPSFDISSVVLNMENKDKVRKTLLKKLQQMKKSVKKKLILYLLNIPEEPKPKKNWKSKKVSIKNRKIDHVTNKNTFKSNTRRNNLTKRKKTITREDPDKSASRSREENEDETLPTSDEKTQPSLKKREYDDDLPDYDLPKDVSKREWLIGTKFQFDNIKVDEKALDLDTLIPPDQAQVSHREWRFFNKNDWQDFELDGIQEPLVGMPQ